MELTRLPDSVLKNPGKIKNVSFARTNTATLLSSATIPVDDTLPLLTEGVQGLTGGFNPGPDSVGNRLIIHAWAEISSSAGSQIIGALNDNGASGPNAIQVSSVNYANNNVMTHWSLTGEYDIVNTTPLVFNVRFGCEVSSNLTINGVSGSRRFGNASTSGFLFIEEEV